MKQCFPLLQRLHRQQKKEEHECELEFAKQCKCAAAIIIMDCMPQPDIRFQVVQRHLCTAAAISTQSSAILVTDGSAHLLRCHPFNAAMPHGSIACCAGNIREIGHHLAIRRTSRRDVVIGYCRRTKRQPGAAQCIRCDVLYQERPVHCFCSGKRA